MKRELLNSLISQQEASVDYSSLIHEHPKLDTVNDCSRQYHLYNQAIQKSRNNVVLFSVYQGRVLVELKDEILKGGKEQYKHFLKELDISTGKANFQIKLFKLTSTYQKLMYSTLPLRFFNQYFKVIKKICTESREEFIL